MVGLKSLAWGTVIACAASLVEAETLDVSPGGLSDALARARPGDVLNLASGIHPGPVTVPIAVRITGEPGAVIEGNGEGTLVTLAADGIVLEGLELRGSGRDLSRDDAVVLLHESRDITIERCRIEARAFGIYLRAGGGHHIRGNEIVGDASLAVNRRGNGIHLWHSTGNDVAQNRVSDVRDGVYLSFAHENRITGNEGRGLRYGIHYMYSERNHLAGNRFTRCTGGIALMFSLGNHIEGNETHENRDFGILFQQLERSIVVHNRAERNGRGFYLQNSSANEIVENRLAGNGVGAYLTAGSETNVFTGNRFEGNLVQLYQAHAGTNRWSRDGRGNYWSDYVGFDWNGDGIGETPYRLQTAASALMAQRPGARSLFLSPLLALVDWWEGWMAPPATGALDPFPMVTASGVTP